jgi:hypothetical protein
MIRQPYLREEDFCKLTRAEAVAFVIFELMEEVGYEDDIKRIREDVKNVCKIFAIEGLELNALHTLVAVK